MNFRKILLTICLIGALATLSHAENPTQTNKEDNFVLGDKMPSDFGFRYTGWSDTFIVDTFEKTITQGTEYDIRPIHFELSNLDLMEIFLALKKNNFDQMPKAVETDIYSKPPPTRYQLTIQCNKIKKRFDLATTFRNYEKNPDLDRWVAVMNVIGSVIQRKRHDYSKYDVRQISSESQRSLE